MLLVLISIELPMIYKGVNWINFFMEGGLFFEKILVKLPNPDDHANFFSFNNYKHY